ncbi:hypothetical protein NDU88_000984 [Pleurodeles waltl]|uniref:Uncharacterized protein n=1 Tax=Pleurodeles waltl TaxID=8319 RepID=A0AAV7NHQ5_PLEWA|nr:hypothetical protein NDU88_000984 [Pleurodeles waltl]
MEAKDGACSRHGGERLLLGVAVRSSRVRALAMVLNVTFSSQNSAWDIACSLLRVQPYVALTVLAAAGAPRSKVALT